MEEKLYRYFMQDNAVASTVNNLVDVLNEVFGKRIISQGSWPLQSSNLNPSDFYLCVMLKEETHLKNFKKILGMKFLLFHCNSISVCQKNILTL
jgi:hypothetical protein